MQKLSKHTVFRTRILIASSLLNYIYCHKFSIRPNLFFRARPFREGIFPFLTSAFLLFPMKIPAFPHTVHSATSTFHFRECFSSICENRHAFLQTRLLSFSTKHTYCTSLNISIDYVPNSNIDSKTNNR